MLREMKRSVFQARASLGPCEWLGALSFEERCTASISAVAAAGGHIARATLVDYPTIAYPAERDLRLRDKHYDRIASWRGADFIDSIHRVRYDPYALNSLSAELRAAETRAAGTCLFVDITCLTKIHTIALAAATRALSRPGPVVFVYSTPENYAHGADTRRTVDVGWRDVLIVPLVPGAEVGTEARARGVILIGHEPDRLGVALSEVEPVGGALVATHAASRPDFRLVSEERSRRVLGRLSSGRVGGWQRAQVSLSAPDELDRIIRGEIDAARDGDAPLYLFPFGPKPAVLASAMRMSATYPERSWTVYPVPVTYDVDATTGIGSVLAYAVS